jgi:uncharacterized protein (DUF924 family)
MPSSDDVMSFWREAGPEKWFRKDDAFDRTLAERFGALHEDAAAGRLDSWADAPEGALALTLVLDQFSRNMFRGSPKAFAQDDAGARLARRAVLERLDLKVAPDLRAFLFMPLMHSEAIADQELSVRIFHATSPGNLPYAIEHERIIRRFGRFPHRNPILGRHTTPAEENFLKGGGFAG